MDSKSIHFKYKNRICAFKACIIPAVKNGASVSHVPNANKCRKFSKSTPKNVQTVRDSGVYPDAELDYLLEQTDLPEYICINCWMRLSRNPELVSPELPIVEWHRSTKTRHYHDHIDVKTLDALALKINTCPLICKVLYERLPHLNRGEPSENRSKIMELKDSMDTISKQIKTTEKFENKRLSSTKSTSRKLPTPIPTKLEINVIKVCPKCHGQIGKGLHRKSDCTEIRGASKNLFKILVDKNIDEQVASKVISNKIGKNKVNSTLKSGNNKKLSITTKHLRLVDVPPEECIDILRTGKFSKKQYKVVF